MKSYKEYNRVYIGGSDCASLVLRAPEKVQLLKFMEDGDYMAYLVDENAEIGAHYEKVFTATSWISIYDDNGLTFEANAEEINIYRAGNYGCIIQLINGKPQIVNG